MKIEGKHDSRKREKQWGRETPELNIIWRAVAVKPRKTKQDKWEGFEK